MSPYAVLGSPVPTAFERIARACWDPFCDGVYYSSTISDDQFCPFCGQSSSPTWTWDAAS